MTYCSFRVSVQMPGRKCSATTAALPRTAREWASSCPRTSTPTYAPTSSSPSSTLTSGAPTSWPSTETTWDLLVSVVVTVSWSECGGQSGMVRVSWSECRGQSDMVRVSWSVCGGQSVMVSVSWSVSWSECGGQSLSLIHISEPTRRA